MITFLLFEVTYLVQSFPAEWLKHSKTYSSSSVGFKVAQAPLEKALAKVPTLLMPQLVTLDTCLVVSGKI